jgi:site-specific recombinase XerD
VSLRHTILTRLGEVGADAFTLVKIKGYGGVTVSQRYVHLPLRRLFYRRKSKKGL